MTLEKDKPMTAYLNEKYKHETLRKTNNELLHQLTEAVRLVATQLVKVENQLDSIDTEVKTIKEFLLPLIQEKAVKESGWW
jgi:hypothetical protein